MPEALATSKRKFYKILDNLSAPASPAKQQGTGHPNPLIPKSRLHGRSSPYSSLNPGTNSTSQQTSANMAELRARLGIGAADKRISMMPTSGHGTTTPLKPTNTILHKTGSFASLRSIDKERDRVQLKEPLPLPEKSFPAFCPWSHEAFMDRLKTFAPVTNWMPKPAEEVGEMAWVKRGWACVGVETVACAACKKRLVVDFTPAKYGRESKRRKIRFNDGDDALDDYEYEEAFEKGLVEKYKALIIDGHRDSCPWRQAGCKDDIYRIPVVRREWWQKHISEAFLSALAMAEDIGRLNLRDIPIKPTAEKILRDMPPGFFTTTYQSYQAPAPMSRPTTPRPATLTIALTGWLATTESSTNLLSCSACFQRIGLWLYQGPSSSRTDSGHDFPPTTLDLIDQHREHCPFRNAASQAATGDFSSSPAWSILWTTVARWADEQRRRSHPHQPESAPASPLSPSFPPLGHTVSIEATHGGSREENAKLDKERTTKLRKLRKALGIFR
ncbi:zf-C3HC-domain-containing protein, partial [Myriangium duriaei CBS 260.36]